MMDNEAVKTAMQAIWQRSVPQTRQRLERLQQVAEALSSTRSIDPAVQTEVESIAHQLAGSLGMFGHTNASAHAQAIEVTLHPAGLPQPERLQEHVDALHRALADELA